MTTYYCPNCWEELDAEIKICPRCGIDIPRFSADTPFGEKLIGALGHPESTTAMRAAWLLGEMRVEDAVAPLIRLAEETTDIYVAREATRALGKIGTPACRRALARLTHHPARMVQREAESFLKKLSGEL